MTFLAQGNKHLTQLVWSEALCFSEVKSWVTSLWKKYISCSPRPSPGFSGGLPHVCLPDATCVTEMKRSQGVALCSHFATGTLISQSERKWSSFLRSNPTLISLIKFGSFRCSRMLSPSLVLSVRKLPLFRRPPHPYWSHLWPRLFEY